MAEVQPAKNVITLDLSKKTITRSKRNKQNLLNEEKDMNVNEFLDEVDELIGEEETTETESNKCNYDNVMNDLREFKFNDIELTEAQNGGRYKAKSLMIGDRWCIYRGQWQKYNNQKVNDRNIQPISNINDMKEVIVRILGDASGNNSNNTFFEIFNNETKHIHPFFDVDLKKGEDLGIVVNNAADVEKLFRMCKTTIKSIMKEYFDFEANILTMGYVNENVEGINDSIFAKHKKNCSKIASFHFIVINGAVEKEDFINIMKNYKDVSKLFDYSVYNGNSFRHSLTPKVMYDKKSRKKEVNHTSKGFIIDIEGMKEDEHDWDYLDKSFVHVLDSVYTVYHPVKEFKKFNNVRYEQDDEFELILNKSINSNMSKDVFWKLIHGLDGVGLIHGYTQYSIQEEISLLPLFQSIISCMSDEVNEEVISEAIDYVNNLPCLTSKASEKFSDILCSAQNLNNYCNWKTLANMIKFHNNDYYEQHLKDILIYDSRTNQIVSGDVDSDDSFTTYDIYQKDYINGNTFDIKQFLTDLRRVMIVVDTKPRTYMFKDLDTNNKCITYSYMNEVQTRQYYENIKLGKMIVNDKEKELNVWSILNHGKNKNNFLYSGIRFYSKDKRVFSWFHGYKYQCLETIDQDKIKDYLEFIRVIIANGNEECYEYILNWISLIIQKPNAKTETAIVIKGKQGTGKTCFTNRICKLLKGYSKKNVTNIDDIVGKFNASIENNKLIVCNELTSAEANKYLNSDALKSVITEKQIEINQKNEKVRTCENVCNLIIVSNNDAPIKIENGDRRYVVLETSAIHKDDFDYFSSLHKNFDDDFYNNLFTFFMKRDISNYNPRRIPMTEAKKQIMELSKTHLEIVVSSFVEEYNEQLAEGWNTQFAYQSFKTYLEDNGHKLYNNIIFGREIIKYCDKKRVRLNGKLEWQYLLKDEFKIPFDEEQLIE